MNRNLKNLKSEGWTGAEISAFAGALREAAPAALGDEIGTRAAGIAAAKMRTVPKVPKKCAHGRRLGECDRCDAEADFQFDRARGDAHFGRWRF